MESTRESHVIRINAAFPAGISRQMLLTVIALIYDTRTEQRRH